jgi:hypothetical protein
LVASPADRVLGPQDPPRKMEGFPVVVGLMP